MAIPRSARTRLSLRTWIRHGGTEGRSRPRGCSPLSTAVNLNSGALRTGRHRRHHLWSVNETRAATDSCQGHLCEAGHRAPGPPLMPSLPRSLSTEDSSLDLADQTCVSPFRRPPATKKTALARQRFGNSSGARAPHHIALTRETRFPYQRLNQCRLVGITAFPSLQPEQLRKEIPSQDPRRQSPPRIPRALEAPHDSTALGSARTQMNLHWPPTPSPPELS